jgi:hypothetical protein
VINWLERLPIIAEVPGRVARLFQTNSFFAMPTAIWWQRQTSAREQLKSQTTVIMDLLFEHCARERPNHQ